MAMLKIFATPEELASAGTEVPVVERYPSFVIADVGDAQRRALARRFPTEDMAPQYRIAIGGDVVDPMAAAPARARAFRAAALPPGPHHYVVQFIGPVKRPWLAALRKAGATLREPMSGFAYVVLADGPALERIRALPSVRWVGHLPHADRIAPALIGDAAAMPRRRVLPGVLTIEVFDDADLPAIRRAAEALGFTVVSEDAAAQLLKLSHEGTAKQQRTRVQALAAVHGVRYIRERVLPRPSNNVAVGVMGNAFASVRPNGLQLTGDGEVVAVCDTGLDSGDPDDLHPDFRGRVVAIRSYPITPDWKPWVTNPGANDGPADLDSGHGTHVAGSVLGDGSASADLPQPVHGHAVKAKLVFQAIEQEMRWKPTAPAELRRERYLLAGIPANMAPLFQFAYDKGARIHSNSWGGGDPGDYDEQCRQFDDFVWKHKDLCFVIAAGNDGSDKDGDGRINPGSVSSPGTSKNCITVGACENRRPEFNAQRYGDWWPDDFPAAPFKAAPMADDPRDVVAFSSRGPTLDGRFKPDVVAPGTFILSTRSTRLAPNNFAWGAFPPNKLYFHMGGTSMATPLVAGAVALVREALRKRHGLATPSAALLKAVLIAGAVRLPKTAPAGTVVDNHQGFGAVHLDRSLTTLILAADGAPMASGEAALQTLQVATAGRTLRVVLAYSDFPGKGLINNLNLLVTSPSGRRYVGNQRSGSRGALVTDTQNNVELVQVARAAKGTWTVQVVASNVVQGPQDHALAAVLV